MIEIILYPTETIYALGVKAYDVKSREALYALKQRDYTQTSSALVRSVEDIEKYAIISETARVLIDKFLPGPLTIVLPAKETVPVSFRDTEGMTSFRISPDPVARKVVADFMEMHNAPLTCTSANLHGLRTAETVPEIMDQFGELSRLITKFFDDGPRSGKPSTVVSVRGEEVTILREGAIPKEKILS